MHGQVYAERPRPFSNLESGGLTPRGPHRGLCAHPGDPGGAVRAGGDPHRDYSPRADAAIGLAPGTGLHNSRMAPREGAAARPPADQCPSPCQSLTAFHAAARAVQRTERQAAVEAAQHPRGAKPMMTGETGLRMAFHRPVSAKEAWSCDRIIRTCALISRSL